MTNRIGTMLDDSTLLPLRDLWAQMAVGRYDTEPTWDIIKLREDRLYVPQEPIMTYGKQAISPTVATWHFTSTTKLVDVGAAARMVSYYVDDRDLAGVMAHPFRHGAEWLAQRVAGVVTPNFSIYGDYRISERLYRRDRAFAIGRYWQEIGINVLPDLEWADDIDFDWFAAGLPKSVPAIMLQAQRGARSKHAVSTWLWAGVKHLLDNHEIGTIFLYCSSKIFEFLIAPFRDRTRWVHIPTYREIRRGEHGGGR